MSKKKGFTGSTTMKLKDFHGGSIPSDHPLPSAPGASCWDPVRGGGASGTISVGRSDHLRPRPASASGPLGGGGVASSTRSLDERPPSFLSHIGLHFDEDERKPLDVSSVPRRSPVHDASSRAPLTAAPVARSEPKQRPISSPVTYPPLGGASAAAPNAWGASKDVASEPLAAQSKWSASRIAQASAVEKVSSGLWKSKPTLEAQVVGYQETEPLDRRFGESIQIADRLRMSVLVAEHEDEVLRSVHSAASYGEPKETFYSDKEKRVQERGRFMSYQDTSERSSAGLYSEGARPVSNEGRFTVQKMPEQGVEVPERPKLKILPRMKPMESPDTQLQFSDGKQVHQPPASLVHVQNAHEVQGSVNTMKPRSVGVDDGNQAVARPKLTLKPRTQPVERLIVNNEKERNNLFGGARPRELVLKERGIDVAVSDLEVTVQSNRARNDLRSDAKQEPNPPSSQSGETAGSIPRGQRSGRDVDKSYHSDAERANGQRSSWKNDNRKAREIEKPLEQLRPEPETWRKPIEQPKVENPGPLYGKLASSLELAQAFSRSMSDDRALGSNMNSKTIPGGPQVPFSRLTNSRELYSGSNQRQINGY